MSEYTILFRVDICPRDGGEYIEMVCKRTVPFQPMPEMGWRFDFSEDWGDPLFPVRDDAERFFWDFRLKVFRIRLESIENVWWKDGHLYRVIRAMVDKGWFINRNLTEIGEEQWEALEAHLAESAFRGDGLEYDIEEGETLCE